MTDAQGYHRKPRYNTPKFPYPFKVDERRLLKEATYLAKKAPAVGPWLSRAAHITGIVAIGNTPNPWLFVRAAWDVAPRLIYLWIKPFRLAEEANRFLGKSCGKKQKGLLKQFAKKVGVQTEGNPLFDIDGPHQWAVFQVAGEFALKAGWYFMLADRISESVNSWVSLPYQWIGQDTPGDPYYLGQAGPGALDRTSGDQMVLNTLEAHNIILSATGFGVPAGFGVTASMQISCDQPYTFELWNNGVQLPGTTMSRNKSGQYITQNMSMYEGEPVIFGSLFSILCHDDFNPPPHGTINMWGSGAWFGKQGLTFDP